MSNTPETDAHQSACLRSGGRSCDGGRNAYWLARKLERERDEARGCAEVLHCQLQVVGEIYVGGKVPPLPILPWFESGLDLSREALIAAVKGGSHDN